MYLKTKLLPFVKKEEKRANDSPLYLSGALKLRTEKNPGHSSW